MILIKKKYDYLIVGAGPYGSVSAYELTKRGKKCNKEIWNFKNISITVFSK